MRKLFKTATLIVFIQSCANEPESRTASSNSIDDIVPATFRASSDHDLALSHIESGLGLVEAGIGEPKTLGLSGEKDQNINSLAKGANELLDGIVGNMTAHHTNSMSLSDRDQVASILKPSPGEECRSQLDSIPKTYSTVITSTKILLKTMKDFSEGKGDAKQKWTITPAPKSRRDSFAFIMTQSSVGPGKDPISLAVSGGSDSGGLYTAKFVLSAPNTITIQYRIFGDSNRKILRASAKLNLLKAPNFDDGTASQSSNERDLQAPAFSKLNETTADIDMRLDLHASSVARQSLTLNGSFHSATATGAVDMVGNIESLSEMPNKNNLEVHHKIYVTGQISDIKNGNSKISYDQNANIKYERGTDDKGEYCAVNGIKAPVTAPKPVPNPGTNIGMQPPPAVENPNPSPLPAEDISFSNFKVKSFKAEYFDKDKLVYSEQVTQPSINYAWSGYKSIPSESFRAIWNGSIDVAEKDQTIYANFDVSWSDVKYSIDGVVVEEWKNQAKTIPKKLSVGNHTIKIEYSNHWHTTGFNVSFTRNAIHSKESVKKLLSPELTNSTKILIGSVYESSDVFNKILIKLANQTGPVVLVLTSYHAVTWKIDNPNNVKILGVVYSSAHPASIVEGVTVVPLEVKDLKMDYDTLTGISADALAMTGIDATSKKGFYAGANLDF